MLEKVQSYSYDENGNMIGISDGTVTTTQAFDLLSRMTSYTDGAVATSYAYYPFGVGPPSDLHTPWINSDDVMMVWESDFYDQIGVIALDWRHVFTSGNIFFAMTDDNWGTVNDLSSITIGAYDILIRDLRHQENPAIEVMNAFRISSHLHRWAMLAVVADFVNRNPSAWNRHTDIASMEYEWWLHIMAHNHAPQRYARQGRHAHIDNQRHGATIWSFLPFVP